MKTPVYTLSWKRGVWLTLLFVFALLTAFALQVFERDIGTYAWLVLFIPLVISAGGNTGNQSATLIITALATKDIELRDWFHVVRRELAQGVLLGGFLAAIGFIAAMILTQSEEGVQVVPSLAVGVTLVLVVICGTLFGSVLPLVFQRLGLDPALMSNPFVAGIIDILGILIYMGVALTLMSMTGGGPAEPGPTDTSFLLFPR